MIGLVAASAALHESGVGFPLLTTLVFLPAVGAVLTLLMPERRPELTRIVGYVTSAATLGLAIYLLIQFDTGHTGYQFVSSHSWMPALGIRWLLGVDGISLFMVGLTALLIPIGMLASANLEKPKAFTFWMLILEMSVIGVFLALDSILFFVFFELVLVPMYFLIAGWGHDNRRYAATKFFLYTMTGSAFLFVGLLSVAFLHQHATHQLTFDVRTLTAWASTTSSISLSTTKWLFVAFAIGFAVKVPIVPFHTWLPDAHTDAPTAGSVVLAGVMLKMGTYGFLRFAIPMVPQAAVDLAPYLLVLAVIGITYGAIVAAMQPNLKRIIAYSSVAHLGFVVLGTFALTSQGISGGLFTMLSHGLTTSALFLLVGMLYDRRHTYELSEFRGLWKAVPVFGGLFVAATFASIGLPGFSGFVGEFLALLGTFLTSRWYAVVAATGVILAAVYLLWAVQRAFTGEPDEKNVATRDIGFREICTVAPLLGLSLFLGFYPKPVLDRLEPSVAALVTQVDSHSNHKTPVINLAGKYCVIDADGSEHTVDATNQVRGLFYKGPCDSGAGG
ncbi:MAG TPA: NADH-quinone oxidoreductase subunit M [Acidimicrobiia bacterium]|nr:NADH-quinone oxidoreductase subunit M [Acidimicrobiia bacterium]